MITINAAGPAILLRLKVPVFVVTLLADATTVKAPVLVFAVKVVAVVATPEALVTAVTAVFPAKLALASAPGSTVKVTVTPTTG